jgi:hypothetical protein
MTLLLAMVLAAASSGRALASGENGVGSRTIHPGSIELGISGLLTSVEGTVQAKIGLRGGTFFNVPFGLGGAEVEVSYAHVRSLHQVDLEGNISWGAPVVADGIFPYLGLAGGLRFERLGSYHQTLVPLGATVGLKMLVTESAAVRIDFKIRRLLNDPVQDFTEINVAVGFSLFLRP